MLNSNHNHHRNRNIVILTLVILFQCLLCLLQVNSVQCLIAFIEKLRPAFFGKMRGCDQNFVQFKKT